ncbi:MAG: DUF1552 domain-containing protein [Polyangiaceae bacterium]|nr:DUF1552 domain-containing protein [Polyangiaceae bacterium]
MKFNRKSRRFFLQGAGATLLALPMLESLLPKGVAMAATPKSFIGIGAWNGLYRMYGPDSQLMPRTPESNGSLVGLSKVNVPGCHAIHHGLLSELATANGGRISEIIDEEFTPLLPKMMMMQGFDFIGLGWYHHYGQFGNWHRTAGMDEGNPDMATLDNVLADWFGSQGLPGDVVTYSAASNDTDYGCSFRADGTRTASRFSDPGILWDKYFADAQIPTDFKLLLVDRVLEDYKALKNNPRLGAEDRIRVDNHIEHLYSTQKEVQEVGAVCDQLRPETDLGDRGLVLRTMNDVIVGLISCGMANSFMGWAAALVSDDPEQWHVWSHAGYDNDNDAIADSVAYDGIIAQSKSVMKDMCLDLAKKLDALDQLDNCVIACIQEHNKRGHESWNVPVITFGGAGGTFKTDQYIDYRNIADRDDVVYSRFGFPINQLYANLLMSMGMPASDFEALNKTRDDGAGSPFKAGSGYGVNAIHPDAAFDYSLGGHYASWSNYDLSGWLPQIKA